MATAKPEDDFWRKTINKLDITVPSDGTAPPSLESTQKTKVRKVSDGSRKVLVQKIETTVYVFTDPDGRVYTSNTSQHMYIMGHMTLERGLKLAQEDAAS